MADSKKTAPASADAKKASPNLFIFVNGRRFDADTGVKAEMNYVAIAALAGVKERQVVRRVFAGGEPRTKDVLADETVVIEAGMHFEVESKPAPTPVPAPTPPQ